MKHLLVITIFYCTQLFSQNPVFKVEIMEPPRPPQKLLYDGLEHYTSYFYEDENYTVTRECKGEFGGEVYFESKKDNTVYIADAVCAVIINKINDKYYLTASLAHMDGFYEFYEIDDLQELTVKANDTNYYGPVETKSGMKLLCGGLGKRIILSFKYNSQIYHIVNERTGTYIAIREKSELKKIQSLTKFSMTSHHNDIFVTKDGHYIATFGVFPKDTNKEIYRPGYIDVFENNIKVYWYK